MPLLVWRLAESCDQWVWSWVETASLAGWSLARSVHLFVAMSVAGGGWSLEGVGVAEGRGLRDELGRAT